MLRFRLLSAAELSAAGEMFSLALLAVLPKLCNNFHLPRLLLLVFFSLEAKTFLGLWKFITDILHNGRKKHTLHNKRPRKVFARNRSSLIEKNCLLLPAWLPATKIVFVWNDFFLVSCGMLFFSITTFILRECASANMHPVMRMWLKLIWRISVLIAVTALQGNAPDINANT